MNSEESSGTGASVGVVAMPEQAVVRVSWLRKEYGGTVALDGVPLGTGPGEAVAVMGPPGGGESTLLDMVAGLGRASAGSAPVHGEDLGRIILERAA